MVETILLISTALIILVTAYRLVEFTTKAHDFDRFHDEVKRLIDANYAFPYFVRKKWSVNNLSISRLYAQYRLVGSPDVFTFKEKLILGYAKPPEPSELSDALFIRAMWKFDSPLRHRRGLNIIPTPIRTE